MAACVKKLNGIGDDPFPVSFYLFLKNSNKYLTFFYQTEPMPQPLTLKETIFWYITILHVIEYVGLYDFSSWYHIPTAMFQEFGKGFAPYIDKGSCIAIPPCLSKFITVEIDFPYIRCINISSLGTLCWNNVWQSKNLSPLIFLPFLNDNKIFNNLNIVSKLSIWLFIYSHALLAHIYIDNGGKSRVNIRWHFRKILINKDMQQNKTHIFYCCSFFSCFLFFTLLLS